MCWRSEAKVPPDRFRRMVFYRRAAKLYSLRFSD
jgi:hypothetical protein